MGALHYLKRDSHFQSLSLELQHMPINWDWRIIWEHAWGYSYYGFSHLPCPKPSILTGLWPVKSWPLPSPPLTLWPCCLRETSRSWNLSPFHLGLYLVSETTCLSILWSILQTPNPNPGGGPSPIHIQAILIQVWAISPLKLITLDGAWEMMFNK